MHIRMHPNWIDSKYETKWHLTCHIVKWRVSVLYLWLNVGPIVPQPSIWPQTPESFVQARLLSRSLSLWCIYCLLFQGERPITMLRESCFRLQKWSFCSEVKLYRSPLNMAKWNESPGLHFSHHCLTGNVAYTHLAANLTICLLARSPTASRACTVNCWWRRTKKHCFPRGKTTCQ